MLVKKVLHILVASLLLISTSGVIINKHYSGGELFSASLFVEAESCCETSCCQHEHKNNCSEESDFYKLIADFTLTEVQDHEQHFHLLINPVGVELDWNNTYSHNASESVLKHPLYRPPPVRDDLTVLHLSLLL